MVKMDPSDTTLTKGVNNQDPENGFLSKNYCDHHIDDDIAHFGNSKSKKKSDLPIVISEWQSQHCKTCAKKKEGFSLDSAKWLSILLCLYAILKEIKVGEPFLYKYQTDFLNLTDSQITGEIYPYTPYSYMICLIPIFLLTDSLLYKPTMILEMIGQVVYRMTLVFGGSVLSQIVGQIFYGMASASEIGYFSYIYARLEKNQYQKLTSWTRAGTMAGRTFGYLFSQAFILTQLGNLSSLNIISLVMPCIVFIFCIFLPRVHWKVTVGRMLQAKSQDNKALNGKTASQLPKTYVQYSIYRVKKLLSDFYKIYSIGVIRKWSIWWAMTTCMSLQVALFSQTLWGQATTKITSLNGFAEAAYTTTATLAILAMNAFPLNWDKWGELAIIFISTIDVAILLLYSQTESIFVMYACYICYRSLYQVMITIAQWNIAEKMICESYGLVFGANSFIALVMQTILTFIVTDKRGLGISVREQYKIYAMMHFAFALVFLISVAITDVFYLYKSRKIDPKETTTPESNKTVDATQVDDHIETETESSGDENDVPKNCKKNSM